MQITAIMNSNILNAAIEAIAYRSTEHLPFILFGYLLTGIVLFFLGGRVWALLYVALIPFVNWSFGWAPNITLPFAPEFGFNPVTIVTGLVLVVRDFTQREMKHYVLIAMTIGVAWSFYYASPEIAIASAAAFAIAELVDWALFTFTKFRLSTRIMLSSAIAAPIDTTVFLFGAKFLTFPNWLMSIIGKLFGAAIVSSVVRANEKDDTPPPQTQKKAAP